MALTNHIVPDSPTNNFATINPFDSSTTSNVPYLGNIKVSIASTSSIRGNFYVPEGKWYYEVYVNTLNNLYLGLASNGRKPTNYVADEAFGVNNTGGILWNTAATGTAGTGLLSIALAANSTYGIFFDADAKLFWISKNGQWYSCNSSSFSSISKTDVENGLYGFDFSALSGDSYTSNFGNSTTSGAVISVNFGQDPTFGGTRSPTTTYPDKSDTEIGRFFYDPPAGALALCTANLPEGYIKLSQDQTPSDHFKAVTWVGTESTGASDANSINVGHQPDFIWIKARNAAFSHYLFDSVRGLSSGNWLVSDSPNAEETSDIQQFNITSTGIDLLTGYNATNNQNTTYVGYFWRAAGSPDQDYASANDGSAKIINENGSANTSIQDCAALASAAGASITPSKVSANRQNGFSIVKYNGNSTADTNYTIPHGLSEQPDFILFKNLDWATGTAGLAWPVQMPKVPAYLEGMDGTRVSNSWDYTNIYGSTLADSDKVTVRAPTASSEGNRFRVWGNYNFIMYCWHSVEGYSKFGSYIGSGSTPFPFVYVGFRPALVIIKAIDDNGYNSYQSWAMFDTSRDDYNPSNSSLYANANYVEGVDGSGSGSVGGIDILSNGFRILDGSATYSGINNIKHIYMAFAEQPFNYANAR